VAIFSAAVVEMPDSAEIVRYYTTASLLAAAYVAFNCPCGTICECKLNLWYALAATPVAVISFHNLQR
jgi:hypothetical protein